jgi:hypothetical protein
MLAKRESKAFIASPHKSMDMAAPDMNGVFLSFWFALVVSATALASSVMSFFGVCE